MNSLIVSTPRLNLRLQNRDDVLKWVEELPADVRAEISPDWLERLRTASPGDPWTLSFSMELRITGEQVGTCAFKAPPDADGAVEIAYGIDEAERGKGYASEGAAALAEFAYARENVQLVLAHTKESDGASARVLEKCGFKCISKVIDPEDGLVYRWELHRAKSF